MERKVILCLDCNVIFYDGENCRCKNVDKSCFLSKLGIENKHAEGIHGSISRVSQNNSVGQIQGLNLPAAFSSSGYDGIQLRAENLQNINDGTNSDLKAQQEEYRDSPVMNASKQNKTFDLSLEPSHHVPLRGNDENSLASDCLVGVQSHTSDTREETTNYTTVSGVSAPAHEFKNDSSESSKKKSVIPHNTLKPIFFEQEGLQGSRFSGEPSRGEYCAKTGGNNRDLLFNTDSCRPNSHEDMNERNNLRSTNIPEPNCISKNFDFLPMQRDEAHHLQRSSQVISATCDIRGNKLADNDVPLVPDSDEHPTAGTSHRNVEENFVLQDGRFHCKLCTKSYSKKQRFIIHYRNHTGERPFACDKCPKTFISKNYLISHLRIHYDEIPFPCDKCEERFFTEIDLNNHQLKHSVERPYACNKCTKRFTEQPHLTVHLRTHTGEKPFPCDMCDKRFAMKHHLDYHRQTHFRH